ncbi:MAG TPA: glycosyltransferase family 4 protein [Ferruginibacter sp.]|nr:glycosyltransferase family 4 protein [Ferruginibacter sp.]
MDKAVKVLSLVSYKFLPPEMGGQKGIAFFNRYLAKSLDLCCVTTEENNVHGTEGYPIKNLLSNSTLRYINLFYFFTLNRIIRENKITHLIIEHPYYGWLGILLKWSGKVKLVVHSHNIESLRFRTMRKWWWGILWHYEKITHRNADINFFIHDNDRNYAIDNFKLRPEKCITVTYGFEHSKVPGNEEKTVARKMICDAHHIPATEKLLLFNGTLGYKPNLDAVNIILEKINPILLADRNFTYKIIICGNKLPADYNGLVEFKEKNIIYAGFVDDINLYFKGADIFINPVIDGGGIKTKLVEALGYNLSVISSRSGAIGIPTEITRDKMKVVHDGDWEEFARQIILLNTQIQTPPEFFHHFYWGNIAARAAGIINR